MESIIIKEQTNCSLCGVLVNVENKDKHEDLHCPKRPGQPPKQIKKSPQKERRIFSAQPLPRHLRRSGHSNLGLIRYM